jgi:hypothetical protein
VNLAAAEVTFYVPEPKRFNEQQLTEAFRNQGFDRAIEVVRRK